MNHCGQSPRCSYCCAKTMRRISLDRRVVLEREQELDRPLADVARAPGGAAVYCSSPCGTVRWIIALCASQGKSVSSAATPGAGAVEAEAAGDVVPVARRRAEHRGFVDAARRIRSASRSASARIGHRAGDGEAKATSSGGVRSATIGAAAGSAVGVEQLVAADRLDGVGRAGDEMVDGLGIALAPEPVRVGAEGDALACRRRSRPGRRVELALAEDEMAEDEEAAGARPRP